MYASKACTLMNVSCISTNHTCRVTLHSQKIASGMVTKTQQLKNCSKQTWVTAQACADWSILNIDTHSLSVPRNKTSIQLCNSLLYHYGNGFQQQTSVTQTSHSFLTLQPSLPLTRMPLYHTGLPQPTRIIQLILYYMYMYSPPFP